MKPVSKVKLVSTMVLIAIVICGFAFNQLVLLPQAKATQELSKMLELQNRLAPELAIYYKTHGVYPQKLQDLPLTNFDWGHEGATLKDLESFSYTSDGQTFVMRWKRAGFNFSIYLAGNQGESIFSESETNKIQIGATNGR
jgi:hypothetical protein